MTPDLEFYLERLQPNHALYKDGGVWQLWSDGMQEMLFEQRVNETLFDFILRLHVEKNI